MRKAVRFSILLFAAAALVGAGEDKKMAQTTRQRSIAAPVVAPRSTTWVRRAFGPDWNVALPFILPLVLLLAILIAWPYVTNLFVDTPSDVSQAAARSSIESTALRRLRKINRRAYCRSVNG